MSAGAPIPRESFAAALRELDPDALAAFVAELWAATADEVRVDPPVVTVRNGGVRRLRVATGDGGGRIADRIDAVVAADPSAVGELEVPVVEPAELRRRLLYAHSPSAADDICRRFLDGPARSSSYEHEESERAGDGANAVPETEQSPAVDTTAARREPDGANDQTVAGESPSTVAFEAIARTDGRGSIAGSPNPGDDSPSGRSRADRLTGQRAWVGVIALVVLGVVAGAVGGVGPFEEESVGRAGDSGAVANATTPSPSVETAMVGATERRQSGDEDGEGTTAGESTVTIRLDDGEWNGSSAPVPNCNRSFAAVVEIQLRALAQTGGTNDGIRTVRRFSSPRHRDLTGSFERFVDVVRSETYAPLLSADRATYAPRRVDSNTAVVDVSLFRGGDATESYRFRLRKQGSGEYEGCWMIAGVGTR